MRRKSNIRVQGQKLSKMLSLDQFEEIKPLKKFSDKQGFETGEIVLVMIILIIVLVYIDIGGSIVCDIVGFVYPAYQSFKALETNSKYNDVWLTYWFVYALLGLYRVTIGYLVAIIPFFNIVRLGLYIYMFHPKTNGVFHFHDHFVKPNIQSQHQLDSQQQSQDTDQYQTQQQHQQHHYEAEKVDLDDLEEDVMGEKNIDEKKND